MMMTALTSDSSLQQTIIASYYWVASALTTTILLVLGGTLLWWRQSSWSSSKPRQKLHVPYQHPDLPLLMRVLAAFPQSMRRSMALQTTAPKVPLDVIDCYGHNNININKSPYVDIRELVPGKLWRVRYEFVRELSMIDMLKSNFGIVLLDMDNQMKRAAAVAREEDEDNETIQTKICQSILKIQSLMAQMQVLKKMEEQQQTMKKKNQQQQGDDDDANIDQQQQQHYFLQQQGRLLLEAGLVETQDMLIVRLNNPTQGLLLYNPCRIHAEMFQYLETLTIAGEEGGGPAVEYIVSGSSCHTNQLPQAAAAFPKAKIICAAAAEAKCRTVGMRKADFIYTDHHHQHSSSRKPTQSGCTNNNNGFEKAASLLANAGVQLFHVVGDTFTQSLLIVAHGHLLDTDLSPYGNGHRYLHTDAKDWRERNDLSMGYSRLLYYASVANGTVTPGYLPDFRLMACDPSSPFCKFLVEGSEPNADGSSCREMAKSLRTLLTMVPFDVVDNVHSSRKESVPAAEFKDAVAKSWYWLDGKSLLVEET